MLRTMWSESTHHKLVLLVLSIRSLPLILFCAVLCICSQTVSDLQSAAASTTPSLTAKVMARYAAVDTKSAAVPAA